MVTKAPPYEWTLLPLEDDEDGYGGFTRKRSDRAWTPVNLYLSLFASQSGAVVKNIATTTTVLRML